MDGEVEFVTNTRFRFNDRIGIPHKFNEMKVMFQNIKSVYVQSNKLTEKEIPK